MRHQFLLLAAAASCLFWSSNGLQAQDNYFTRDNAFEIEAGTGPNFGLSNVEAMRKNKVGTDLYGEFRYNFANAPLSIGMQVAYNILNRETKGYNDGYMWAYSNYDYTSTDLMLTCDYRKRVSKLATIFGGVGIGMCRISDSAKLQSLGADVTGEGFTDDGPSGSMAFMPRVGIHVANLLRITAGYKFQEKANRHAFVTIGVTFGFRQRR
ncbi:MAG: outer membrane beta-barrel protein [Sodaliphilus pleomorphus]|jgi:opacity protein-like surface antigen|uniref:outer membrane beta-barrel protein n=1 Tax=Sodaliphilus pleomorphus TaxID=2606626 RepID=UPI002409381A|nr:outer membrane beta-barrel protein [Sodaliphilus pleomorphus]MDD6475872.1 outer membrane beta-barrel protein [Sodaliphilus pleomorphus]MDY6260003.1 outer membrane beta-barrel protein [Bacteroidales bacterium]